MEGLGEAARPRCGVFPRARLHAAAADRLAIRPEQTRPARFAVCGNSHVKTAVCFAEPRRIAQVTGSFVGERAAARLEHDRQRQPKAPNRAGITLQREVVGRDRTCDLALAARGVAMQRRDARAQ